MNSVELQRKQASLQTTTEAINGLKVIEIHLPDTAGIAKMYYEKKQKENKFLEE